MADKPVEKRRNTWGWKNPSGTTKSVTFYGFQRGHDEGLVAYFTVQLPQRLPYSEAIPLAEAQLPSDFFKISLVRGGVSAFNAMSKDKKIEQISPTLRVTRHRNAG